MLEALTAVGWQASEVFLFGFSQGGTVALEWALRRAKALKVHQPPTTTARSSNGANFTKTEDNSETAFGGVVAVAAGLLEERQWPALWPPRKHAAEECAVSSEATGTSLRMCACLLIAGKRDSTCPPAWIKRSAGVIDGAELEKDSTATTTATAAFFQKGHAMLGSPAEGQALMGWLAPRLKRLGAWESDPDVFHVS
jgi:predicted esterase